MSHLLHLVLGPLFKMGNGPIFKALTYILQTTKPNNLVCNLTRVVNGACENGLLKLAYPWKMILRWKLSIYNLEASVWKDNFVKGKRKHWNWKEWRICTLHPWIFFLEEYIFVWKPNFGVCDCIWLSDKLLQGTTHQPIIHHVLIASTTSTMAYFETEKLKYLKMLIGNDLCAFQITRIWKNKNQQILISSLCSGNLMWNILLFQLFMKNFTLLTLKTLNLPTKQKIKENIKNNKHLSVTLYCK